MNYFVQTSVRGYQKKCKKDKALNGLKKRKMSNGNKNRYVKFNLPLDLISELYETGQFIKNNVDNFIPMELNDLHMTVIFLGNLSKNLINQKKEKIKKMEEILVHFPLINQLQFKRFELFTEKKNLIVAIFELPEFYKQQILALKQEFLEFGAPNEIVYIPHVTLGKIMNMNPMKKNIDLTIIPTIMTKEVNDLSLILF